MLEKEMATHSSVLAWRIPGMGEPGGLPSLGSHRVGHNWSDLAAAAAATMYEGSSFCTSSSTMALSFFFKSHSSGHELLFHCTWICISQWLMILRIFSCAFLSVCVSSWEKHVFKSFGHFLAYCSARTSTTILNRSGKNGDHCLLPDFRRNALSLSLWSVKLVLWKGVQFCQMLFSIKIIMRS